MFHQPLADEKFGYMLESPVYPTVLIHLKENGK